MKTLKALKLVLPVVIMSLFNTACSTDTVSSREVNSSAIHQSYSLRFSEESNATTMSAQFRVGGWSGTTVDLDDPAHLKINGQRPSKSTFLGTSYELRQNGFVRTAVFEYQGDDGKTLSNTISIDPVILRRADPTINVNQPYEIELEAGRMESGEEIQVRISQNIRRDNTTVYTSANGSFDRARNKVYFSAAELNKLENGAAKLEISRSKTASVSQSTREGGSLSATYSLRPLSVTVVK